MTALHQFVPVLEPGAVGGHTLEVRRALRDHGIESEVFAETVHPSMQGRAHPYRDYGARVAAGRGDVLLYQMAIGSPVASFVRARPERIAVDYHNITPPALFAKWEPDLVHGLAWGRHQLAELAGISAFALADSAYNEQELVELGYHDTAVVPILLDLSTFEHDVDAPCLDRLLAAKRAGGADLLFVGRVAPNKAQHELVKVLAAYRRLYDPHARLHLVGAPASDRYVGAIRSFAAELGLGDAVDLTGPVGAGELAAHYRAADVLVSMSVHEGFCVPLLEAMHHRVPIVARAAAAVPETLAGAGILLRASAPDRFAAAIHRVVTDAHLRAELVAAGVRRLADFSLERTRARLLDAVGPFVDRAPVP
ncbi:MAG: glycosyltransferase family 4 protein [Acidimicrobiia bacterium]